MTNQQMSTFEVGGHLFGVDVADVQEVLRYQELTRVPLAPPAVSGLINLRGQVVTAVNLRHRLGLPEREDGALPMNVIVRTEDGAISLLVDAIGDVVDTTSELFETPPDTLTGPARELVKGAYKLDGRLLLTLDVGRAVDVAAAA